MKLDILIFLIYLQILHINTNQYINLTLVI